MILALQKIFHVTTQAVVDVPPYGCNVVFSARHVLLNSRILVQVGYTRIHSTLKLNCGFASPLLNFLFIYLFIVKQPEIWAIQEQQKTITAVSSLLLRHNPLLETRRRAPPAASRRVDRIGKIVGGSLASYFSRHPNGPSVTLHRPPVIAILSVRYASLSKS
jgi:hypothetical protein